jgi:hypothetical protein
MRWAGHVANMGEGGIVYRDLMVKPEERDHLKDQGVDGRMGSKWTLGRLGGGCVLWIHVAQDRDSWRTVVNAVMNIWILAPRSFFSLVSYRTLFQDCILGSARVAPTSRTHLKISCASHTGITKCRKLKVSLHIWSDSSGTRDHSR